MKILHWTSKKS